MILVISNNSLYALFPFAVRFGVLKTSAAPNFPKRYKIW
jgi:hypothetical protein